MSRKPIRILQVVGRMDRGGAESFIMNLYRRINRDNVQFDFAVQTQGPCDFDEEICSLGGRIYHHPHPRQVGIWRWLCMLMKTLRTGGPFRGVHCHMLFMSGVVMTLSRRAEIPLRIAHAHNTTDSEGNSMLRKTYRIAMKYQIKRKATHIFGCSRRVCEWMYSSACWDDNRIRVIANGVDLQQYVKQVDDRAEIRKQLGLPTSGMLVGHVGAFRPQKNHYLLIKIFKTLKSIHRDCNLVMAGTGCLLPEIRRMVEEMGLSGSVHFLGLRKDIPKVLSSLDVFLFPSLYEGVPVALIEAQAVGVPFVTAESVYNDSDLGLGLGEAVSLDAPEDVWRNKCLEAMSKSRPTRESRFTQLRAMGYDIDRVAMEMEQIYVSQ